MQCSYYQQKQCLSCHWIDTPYSTQIANKQAQLSQQLVDFNPQEVKKPIESDKSAFRNKAKMAVIGTVEKPMLGIQTGDLAVDLCDCPLYSNSMQNVLKIVRTYIRKQGLVPYNVNKRKGELKFVVVTESISDDMPEGNSRFMLRFVLRTHKFAEKIKVSLNQLQEKIHNLQIVSINIQPTHAAILEGDEELILTENQYLPITLNHVLLFIKPKSFFQTNTQVAEKLYQTAHDWVNDLNINSIWDLFCGVGGFGLHCVNHTENAARALIGIEINPEAIECAKKSASLLGIKQLSFKSLDATQYALSEDDIPDLVLLNPPRRGAGKPLMTYLQQIKPNYILYSSCNLLTLAEDLTILSGYQVIKVQLFDMFPHTPHMEVLTLLKKKIENPK